MEWSLLGFFWGVDLRLLELGKYLGISAFAGALRLASCLG